MSRVSNVLLALLWPTSLSLMKHMQKFFLVAGLKISLYFSVITKLTAEIESAIVWPFRRVLDFCSLNCFAVFVSTLVSDPSLKLSHFVIEETYRGTTAGCPSLTCSCFRWSSCISPMHSLMPVLP